MTNRDDTLRPTLADFVRHARRFGPAHVVETAREYLAEPDVVKLEAELALLGRRRGERNGARQRRTTPGLRDQVVALRERGLLPSVIADTLNLSDRRVSAILAEKSRTCENGVRDGLTKPKKMRLRGEDDPRYGWTTLR